ncbi:unnamed protein product, partial [Musa textilis]
LLDVSPSCCFSVYSTVLDGQRTLQRPFVEHIQLAIVSNGCALGWAVIRPRNELPLLWCGGTRSLRNRFAAHADDDLLRLGHYLMVIVASRWWVDLLST